MTADLVLMVDNERDVVGVDGWTTAGIEFVDAFICAPLVAVDSGRIVIPRAALSGLLAQARERGLAVEKGAE